MTDTITIYEGKKLSTSLQKSTNKIVKCYDNIESNFFTIARELANVKNSGSYEKDFNTYEEYTKTVLGFKKSFAYELAKIGSKFTLENTNASVFRNEETGEDFKQTQLAILIRLDIDIIKEALANGEIKYSSTTKELRLFVNRKKIEEIARLTEPKPEPKPEITEPEVIEPDTDQDTSEDNIEYGKEVHTLSTLESIKSRIDNLSHEVVAAMNPDVKKILTDVRMLLSDNELVNSGHFNK